MMGCISMPRQEGVNTVVAVMLQGTAQLLHWCMGADARGAGELARTDAVRVT
jgi:hypothetical protein